MSTITRESLMTLEAYAKARPQFRKKAIAHKALRKVFIGEHVVLQFEDELTIRYQIQEMLRIEKTFDEQGILDELEAYNPLVPDACNWKATQTIEYADVEERRLKLMELKGIETRTYVQVDGFDPVYAIADEDLPRENHEKTSAVHFLRFELGKDMIAAIRDGAAVSAGIDHSAYNVRVPEISPITLASLLQDFA